MLAACNAGPDADEPAAPQGDGANAPADSPPTGVRPNTVLARYHGEYNGRELTFTPITEQPTGRAGQIAQRFTIGALPTTSSGATPPPEPPTNGAQVHQIGARQLDTACNTLATTSGDTGIPAGFTGVCFRMEAINGLLTQGITRAYVEISNLVNRNGSGTIAVLNTATLDTELIPGSTSNIFFNHHVSNSPANNWLAPHGSTTTYDRVTRNWYFDTPEAGASSAFNFTATVYGQPVNPVRRIAPSAGAPDCAVDAVSRPAYSLDGVFVAYVTSDPACSPDRTPQVYRRNIATGQTVLVSHAFGSRTATANAFGAIHPTISRDGRYVALITNATNMVSAATMRDTLGQLDNNGEDLAGIDVYVVDVDDAEGDAIYIASTNSTGTTVADTGIDENSIPMIAPQGNFVVFDTPAALLTSDANGRRDVYRRAFLSSASTTSIRRVTTDPAGRTGDCSRPTVAINGTPVAFECTATGFAGDATPAFTDVYVAVVPSSSFGSVTYTLVSKNGTTQALGNSNNIFVAADGTYVAWESTATNMVGPSGLGFRHVYVANFASGATSGIQRADTTRTGAEAAGNATLPVLTSSGRFVAFTSTATNIDPIDTNANNDAYMFDVRSPDSRRKRAFVWNTTATNQLPAAASVSTGVAVEGVRGVYGIFMSPASEYDGSAPTGDNLYLAPLR